MLNRLSFLSSCCFGCFPFWFRGQDCGSDCASSWPLFTFYFTLSSPLNVLVGTVCLYFLFNPAIFNFGHLSFSYQVFAYWLNVFPPNIVVPVWCQIKAHNVVKGSNTIAVKFYYVINTKTHLPLLFEPHFAYEKTKAQISCAVTAQLISAFDFVTYM